jgi:hypothetical protein
MNRKLEWRRTTSCVERYLSWDRKPT